MGVGGHAGRQLGHVEHHHARAQPRREAGGLLRDEQRARGKINGNEDGLDVHAFSAREASHVLCPHMPANMAPVNRSVDDAPDTTDVSAGPGQ